MFRLPQPLGDPANVPFRITNTTLGNLEFEINPSEYDPRVKQPYTLVPAASGAYEVSTLLFDNEPRVMKFPELTQNFFSQLVRYAELDNTYRLRQCNFTDGNYGAFSSTPIRVIRVDGQAFTHPDASGMLYRNVEVEFVVDQ